MLSKEHKEIINKTLAGLKDFQKRSVKNAYNLFYNQNKNRLLIADEVGLGKTIIAKGIIAKVFEKYANENKNFHVIYICANQALASQNLEKLNFLDVKNHSFQRLTFLAYKDSIVNKNFQINTLTPSTSFNITKSTGVVEERAIIFLLLSNYHVFQDKDRKKGLKKLLQGYAKTRNWNAEIKRVKTTKQLRTKIYSLFRSQLLNTSFNSNDFPKTFNFVNTTSEISLWEALTRITKKPIELTKKKLDFLTEIIASLRTILTKITIDSLDADLYILDEFQRFKDLIDTQNTSESSEIAQAIFQKKNSKVLLLSATPFKPFTDKLDSIQGEDHYVELKRIMKFLLDTKNDTYWNAFEEDRKAFFNLLSTPNLAIKNIEASKKIKNKIEKHFRAVISRNERTLVIAKDKSLIKENINLLTLKPEDIEDYIYVDKVILEINQHIEKTRYKIHNPIEYAKSVPFPLSFSENYKLNKELKDKIQRNLIKPPSKGLLNYSNIYNYKPVMNTKEIPNGKIRNLIQESLIDNQAYLFLWIPPSLPYYKPFGAYKKSGTYSKTLVFSSWTMVPRAIATLVSYESERLTIGKSLTTEEKPNKYTSRIKPQLLFALENKEPKHMYNFCLLYPSLFLANSIEINEFINYKSHREVLKNISNCIDKKLYTLNKYIKKQAIDKRWYWVAPLLLDENSENSELVQSWLHQLKSLNTIINTDDDKEINSVKTNKGKSQHLKSFKAAFFAPNELNLGTMPKDLAIVLAQMSIGSPAITSLRALKNTTTENDLAVLQTSLSIAESFITLYNKPQSIAIIKNTAKTGKGYWHNTIQYAISGNIQAMLDEYFYLLYDGSSAKDKLRFIANQVKDVLSTKSASLTIETKNSILNDKKKKAIRTHFAMSFGTQKINIAGSNRLISIREAFNSPFRPFVLASTSIGQEGLDFHYYCRKITHWNLPSNAIDIEQREGRINRYKGLVIRQIIADKHKNYPFSNNQIWKTLFELENKSKKETSDMIPFWHINDNEKIFIERNIPFHPFSKDIEKYDRLKKTLAIYRLTFGQPNQENLIETLQEKLAPEEIEFIRKELLIDLSPK